MTKKEWVEACAKRYMERGGVPENQAYQMAEDAYFTTDGKDDPEGVADDDMSYWTDDEF